MPPLIASAERRARLPSAYQVPSLRTSGLDLPSSTFHHDFEVPPLESFGSESLYRLVPHLRSELPLWSGPLRYLIRRPPCRCVAF